MSQRVLLLAVRDTLRDRVPLKAEECEVTGDEQPFPIVGDRFVGVHPGYWRQTGVGLDLDEEYGISVTVSVRATKVASDRVGPQLLAKARGGLLELCEQVRAAIHMDSQESATAGVLPRANQMLGNQVNGFEEPLIFQDGGRATKRGAAWFGGSGARLAGLSQTLLFGRARRIQTIESMA